MENKVRNEIVRLILTYCACCKNKPCKSDHGSYVCQQLEQTVKKIIEETKGNDV